MKQENEMLIRIEERLNNLITSVEQQLKEGCQKNHVSLERKIYLKILIWSITYIPTMNLSILKIAKILGFI